MNLSFNQIRKPTIGVQRGVSKRVEDSRRPPAFPGRLLLKWPMGLFSDGLLASRRRVRHGRPG
jgi:hypothetical protein